MWSFFNLSDFFFFFFRSPSQNCVIFFQLRGGTNIIKGPLSGSCDLFGTQMGSTKLDLCLKSAAGFNQFWFSLVSLSWIYVLVDMYGSDLVIFSSNSSTDVCSDHFWIVFCHFYRIWSFVFHRFLVKCGMVLIIIGDFIMYFNWVSVNFCKFGCISVKLVRFR